MAKNSRLKMPGPPEEYTPEQALEIMKCMQDPVYFIETYCKITHPTRGMVGFNLYDFQRELVKSFHENRSTIVCASRQIGKSQTSCGFLLWYACFNSHKEILIISNKAKNAKDMVKRIVFMYENLPNWIKPAINPNNWNKLEIEFANKNRIVSESTTDQSGRGMSVSLLFCDEFAFVEPNIAEEFWTSISPTLSTGGSCIIASTPNGDDNKFAELWRGANIGNNGFVPFFVQWDTVPGRDEAYKQQEIGKIGLQKWEQEYECKFISSDPLLFSSTLITNYYCDTKAQQDAREITWFDHVNPGRNYIIAIDPSTGTGSDYTVMILYSFPELEQIAQFRSNTTSTPLVYNTFKHLLRTVQAGGAENCYWSFENNGIGEGFISMYESDENPIEFGDLISEPGKRRIGFFTGKNKTNVCLLFKQIFESNKIKIKSPVVISEMKNFVRRNGSFAARSGSNDDTIAAHLILVRMLQELVQYEERAYDVVFQHNEGDYFDEEYDDYMPPPPVFGHNGGVDVNFEQFFPDGW